MLGLVVLAASDFATSHKYPFLAAQLSVDRSALPIQVTRGAPNTLPRTLTTQRRAQQLKAGREALFIELAGVRRDTSAAGGGIPQSKSGGRIRQGAAAKAAGQGFAISEKLS